MSASEATALYHDRGTSGAGALTTNEGALIFNPWYSITRGTSISNRIGDEVVARGMSLRLQYVAAADRPAQFVRIIIAVIPKLTGTTVLDGTNYDLMDAHRPLDHEKNTEEHIVHHYLANFQHEMRYLYP